MDSIKNGQTQGIKQRGAVEPRQQIVRHDTQATMEPFQPANGPRFDNVQHPEKEKSNRHPCHSLRQKQAGGPYPHELVEHRPSRVGIGFGDQGPSGPDSNNESNYDQSIESDRIFIYRSEGINQDGQQAASRAGG